MWHLIRFENSAGRPDRLGSVLKRLPFAAGLITAVFGMTFSALDLRAQGFGSGATDGDTAIEILADDGIEWLRDSRRYIARGNATAIRDGVVIKSTTMTAYYRDGNGEGQNRQTIFRLDADEDVVITSGETMATGDKGVYHVEKKVAVLIGEKLQLIDERAIITARDSLEYWEEKQLAVARGDATVIEGENRLVADILTAYIRPNAQGVQEVQRIDALNGVHISTGTEIIRGREGVYDVPKQTASVCGDVKITRGENQLNGECAVVDMKTGRSRLSAAPGGGKVKGLILQTE